LTLRAGMPALCSARVSAGGSASSRACAPRVRQPRTNRNATRRRSGASNIARGNEQKRERLECTKLRGARIRHAVFLLLAETPYCARKRLLPGARMRWLRNTFLKGLAALLPVALTIFVVYWLATTAESVASGPLRALLPADRYWPGLGLLVACLL